MIFKRNLIQIELTTFFTLPEKSAGNKNTIEYVLFLTMSFLFLISCSENFEPFQENDRYNFSIYGFLDASADTQWVRVSPVRGEFDTPAEKPDMNVTVENLENGTITVMNDSLLQLSQGFNALNVWSKMNIEYGQTYRLRAEQAEGESSEATVTVPQDFPTPRLFIERIPEREPRYFLLIDEVEHLADVQSRWYFRISTPFWEERRMVSLSLKEDAFVEEPGRYTVQMFPDVEMEVVKSQQLVLSQPDSEIEFLHHQIFVASGGPEWDENISSIDDLVYTLPDGFSNVENGLGYLVGVVSKLFPFESCRDENNQLIGCPLEDPFF